MSSIELSQSSAEQLNPAKSTRIRLEYLDGMRGIAALYVVWFHIYLDVINTKSGIIKFPYLLNSIIEVFMSHGASSVAIFIVLSGYCLMLPVAKSSDGKLRGGVVNYIKRRARRILPPYYAALFFSLLLSALVPATLMSATGWHWNSGQPAFTLDGILSHLLLLHNLKGQWLFPINPPMWSVALEWQIYFVFAFLLLPVWRRFGIIPVLVFASIFGAAIGFRIAHWWYIILFTLGMIGATIGFSKKPSLVNLKERFPWDLVTSLLGGIWISLVIANAFALVQVNIIFDDILLGVVATGLIIACTRFLSEGIKTNFQGVLRILEGRWLVKLGSFSYSLYLVHTIAMALLQFALKDVIRTPLFNFILLSVLGLPLCLLSAYIFHIIFEKPFMSN
ncbi:acyltransferase [Microcoleus anatoxicus]|uniref:acyltransferase family protein n=1 Tax=Microcoleus anatoxicus TaxID=2705319 RepID=UPI0030C959FE